MKKGRFGDVPQMRRVQLNPCQKLSQVRAKNRNIARKIAPFAPSNVKRISL